MPKGRQIFLNLTVRENLAAFAGNRSGSANLRTVAKVFSLFPGLAELHQIWVYGISSN